MYVTKKKKIRIERLPNSERLAGGTLSKNVNGKAEVEAAGRRHKKQTGHQKARDVFDFGALVVS